MCTRPIKFYLISSLSLPSPPVCLGRLCSLPVGEGEFRHGRGLSPRRTGALSPEGQSHRLTDSLATSNTDIVIEGERNRKREKEREGDREIRTNSSKTATCKRTQLVINLKHIRVDVVLTGHLVTWHYKRQVLLRPSASS